MTVLITLTAAGTDTGPFDLYSDLDGYTVPFETGVSKAALLGGYTSTLVPDYTETVRVKSTGDCINYVDILLQYPVTTTTTTTTAGTTTTTTTAAYNTAIQLHLGACGDIFFPDYTYYVDQAVPAMALGNGDVAYFEAGFITPIDGLNQLYTGIFNGIKYQFNINTIGVISSVLIC